MIIISIDPGTYSLKYLVTEHHKKNIKLLDMGEIVLEHHLVSEDQDVNELYGKIIGEIREGFSEQSKICMVMPAHLTTSRFLTLPVKNKKKAEMMIPFQLEEELPYSLSDLHYAAQVSVKNNQSHAAISVANKNDFENFFSPLAEKNLHPHYLTNTLSLLSDLNKTHKIDQHFCILDLGHNTSKAYFFYNGELVSKHISYIAGKTITEAISKCYGIPSEEANQYKKDNAFVLTDNQLAEVNDTQRKFASLMGEILGSLINDFKRWDLGFKVAYQTPIQNVYLLGGTAHIKNIESYLLEKLNYPITHLSSEITLPLEVETPDKFLFPMLLAHSYPRRNKMGSYLTGEYTPQLSDDLPLHSISFIGIRIAILSLFTILFLLVEQYYIGVQKKSYTRKLKTRLKHSQLNLSAADIRKINRKPQLVLNKLKKQERSMEDARKALASMQGINSLSPLLKLSTFANQQDVLIDQFSSNQDQEVIAVLKSKPGSSARVLRDFQKKLRAQGWPELKATLSRDQKKLTIRYYGGN